MWQLGYQSLSLAPSFLSSNNIHPKPMVPWRGSYACCVEWECNPYYCSIWGCPSVDWPGSALWILWHCKNDVTHVVILCYRAKKKHSRYKCVPNQFTLREGYYLDLPVSSQDSFKSASRCQLQRKSEGQSTRLWPIIDSLKAEDPWRHKECR